MSQQKAEDRAESLGSLDREVGQPRDTNPYLQLIAQNELESKVIAALAAAWWRGWDRADTVRR